MSILNSQQWDSFIEQWPDAHLLQTSMWGDLKSQFGWQPVRLSNRTAGSQVLFRKRPLGLSLAYIPKGPVGENWNDLCPKSTSMQAKTCNFPQGGAR